jgi:hypothetical protein
VVQGRLVVAPTRPLNPAGETIPYLGESTRTVAATFLDPRTGRMVNDVVVGDTLPGVYFGASVAVSPDGDLVAITSGLVTTILDARTRDVVETIELPPEWDTLPSGALVPAGAVCCAVWSGDGSRLFLGTGGALPGLDADTAPRTKGAIAVVDTATWDVVDRSVVDRVPEVMELSPDGRTLAMASVNSTYVVLRDAESLAERGRIDLRTDDSLWALSFSGDGRLLAAGGEKGLLHIADTRTLEAREPVLVQETVLQLEWLPDNRTVVATGNNAKVTLFDAERSVVRSGALAASLENEPAHRFVVPDPDGEIVILSDERVGLSYPLDPDVWLREACDIVGRNLTRIEWERYLPGRQWEPTCSDLG